MPASMSFNWSLIGTGKTGGNFTISAAMILPSVSGWRFPIAAKMEMAPRFDKCADISISSVTQTFRPLGESSIRTAFCANSMTSPPVWLLINTAGHLSLWPLHRVHSNTNVEDTSASIGRPDTTLQQTAPSALCGCGPHIAAWIEFIR